MGRCLKSLVNHLPESGVGRCLTRLVSHPPGWGDLQIDMQLEGCLVTHEYFNYWELINITNGK